MQPEIDNQLRVQARKRVEFKTHLVVYCVVIGSLWVIWALTSRGYMWPIWPMMGWGIGLIFHYAFDYQPSNFFSEEEEYRKLKRNSETEISK